MLRKREGYNASAEAIATANVRNFPLWIDSSDWGGQSSWAIRTSRLN